MATEQVRTPETMSPSEQGKATFRLQKDFFAGERRLESYLDGLHNWRMGDLYPTNFGNPHGVTRYRIDDKTFFVQIGVHYTGPDTTTHSSLERTLKIDIVEDVKNGWNRPRTTHTKVIVNSGYLAKIKSNDIEEHTHGKVKVFKDRKQIALDEGDPTTYEYLRKLLSPVINSGSEKVDDVNRGSGFAYFAEELPANEPMSDDPFEVADVQLGVTGQEESLLTLQIQKVGLPRPKPNLEGFFPEEK